MKTFGADKKIYIRIKMPKIQSEIHHFPPLSALISWQTLGECTIFQELDVVNWNEMHSPLKWTFVCATALAVRLNHSLELHYNSCFGTLIRCVNHLFCLICMQTGRHAAIRLRCRHFNFSVFLFTGRKVGYLPYFSLSSLSRTYLINI